MKELTPSNRKGAAEDTISAAHCHLII